MIKFLAQPRLSGADQVEMTPLEYALVAAFILMSLIAAVPGVAIALEAALRRVLDPFT